MPRFLWCWALAILWSWPRLVSSQYANEYNHLDIYPRPDLKFHRNISSVDNSTVGHIFYLHDFVVTTLHNLRYLDEKIISTGATVNVEEHSLSGRHMFHSAVKTERMARAEPYECYFETMSRELQEVVGPFASPLKYEGPVSDAFCRPYHEYPCPEEAIYRTIDGTCNNVDNPAWGSAVTCYRRFLPAQYSDGISAFRLDYYGNPLPNPRELANELHYHAEIEANSYTHFLAQWGQWVAHDITQVKPYLAVGHEVLDCCRGDHHSYSVYNDTLYHDPYRAELHPFCKPIYLPRDDAAGSNENCHNFVRSSPCASCKIGPRDQTNKVTAYIDASGVYGSSPETLHYLRDPYDPAKLAVQQTSFGYMLPRNAHPNMDQCSHPLNNQYCFAAGDSRSNQHPGLCIMHTTFVRHHNNLVDIFRHINPHWDNDKLFEEVRRVVGAQIQFVTFREYLHLVIGPTLMTFFDLWTLKTGTTNYGKVLNAGVFNEVASAVYRYGHSLINTEWWRLNTTTMDVISSLDLKDSFFNSDYMYSQPYEEFLLGMIVQPAMKFDNHIHSTMTRYLYRVKGQGFGWDLASMNIYRGLDHGLRGYTQYLEACYGAYIYTFEDLLPFMTQENVHALRKMYRHVTDIDLWTGGLHERLLRDAVVGPTFGCLLGMQYYFLKFGDRFYFEHGGLPSSFTERQLTEIRKTWFSGIMCTTADVRYTTLDVFQPPSENNPILPCSQIPQPDWNAWFEIPHYNREEHLDEYE